MDVLVLLQTSVDLRMSHQEWQEVQEIRRMLAEV